MRSCQLAVMRAGLAALSVVAAQDSPGQSAPVPQAAAKSYEWVFSTYLGGSNGELLRDITVDVHDNIYVAGIAGSADFPRTPGVFPGQSKGGGAMVAKLSPTGRLIWSRVIGTLGESSYFYSVKVDRAGYVFVAGRIVPGFPTTPGAPQPTTSHNCGFVGKLKPDASGWVWATRSFKPALHVFFVVYVGRGYGR